MNKVNIIQRNNFVSLAALVVYFAFSCNRPNEKALQPNIVFIFIDDMGWKDAGFMGSEHYETPHIGRAVRGKGFCNGNDTNMQSRKAHTRSVDD